MDTSIIRDNKVLMGNGGDGDGDGDEKKGWELDRGLRDERKGKVEMNKKRKYDEKKIQRCPDLVNRDWRKNPLRLHEVGGPSYYGKNCPVNCKKVEKGVQAEVTKSGSAKACGAYSFGYTMENRWTNADIVGTTRLSSDVPLPYYSWIDFNFMEPPKEKTEKAMMAAFVSNCGPKKRLNILEKLMEYGVTIDSYGGCLHNRNEPKLDKNKQTSKYMLIQKYKFTFSAENSETIDYVTEKLFLPLVAGSIPVYLGAPNVQHFAPAEKSIIDINAYDSIKALADHIIEISNNDELFNEYMEWKTIGPSRHFKSVMDLPIYHSCCRLCMKAADFFRIEYGNTVGHESYDNINNKERYFKIRERNTFYLKYIYLDGGFTMKDIIKEIRIKFDPLWDVYKIYRLHDNNRIPLIEDEFSGLSNDEELEVVFLDSMTKKRALFTKWEEEHPQISHSTNNNNNNNNNKNRIDKNQYIQDLEREIKIKSDLFKQYSDRIKEN